MAEMLCTVCQSELAADETYICQTCNEEIDRRANEVLGNAEDENE